MGAWGNSFFENDDALDLVDELKECNAPTEFSDILITALKEYEKFHQKRLKGENITVMTEAEKKEFVEMCNTGWIDEDGNSVASPGIMTVEELEDEIEDDGLAEASTAIAASYILLYHHNSKKLKPDGFPTFKDFMPDKKTIIKVGSVLNLILKNELITSPELVDKQFFKNIKMLLTQ